MLIKDIGDKTGKKKHAVCSRCYSNLCEELYWEEIVVSADFFAIPLDCPMRTEDESVIELQLLQLNDYDVSRISGDIWATHNIGHRYVYSNNHKVEEIKYIIGHLRRKQCAIICKAANPDFNPWAQQTNWTSGSRKSGSQTKAETQRDDSSADSSNIETAPSQQLPFKIIGISWEHTDSTRQKESAGIAASGEPIKLKAQFENYVEGAGVDFIVYGNINGSKKQLTKLSTRCANMAATVEWIVDISKCDADNPGVEFECHARDSKSIKCKIQIKSTADFIISF